MGYPFSRGLSIAYGCTNLTLLLLHAIVKAHEVLEVLQEYRLRLPMESTPQRSTPCHYLGTAWSSEKHPQEHS